MVLDNAFYPDQRVLKELGTLTSLNCKVDLFCWDQGSDLEKEEQRDKFKIFRIKIEVAKQIGSAKLKYLFKFYKELLKELSSIENNYDFVYVHDFLLLPIGVILKYKYNLQLIYDAHEIYHIMEWEKYSAFIRNGMFFTERLFLKFADHFIVVSEDRKKFYAKYVNKNIKVVGNWFDEYNGENEDLRTKLNIPKDDIVLGYFGVNNFKVRPIDKIVEIVKQNKNVHFIIGGVGVDAHIIEEQANKYSNIHYLGWLENVRAYFDSLDYVIYVMNNTRKYSKYTAPNTLYLSLSHRKPFITNVVGEPSEVIQKFNVGYFYENVDELNVIDLFDKDNYLSMVKNIDEIRNNYLWSNSKKVYSEILNIKK